MYLEQSFEKQIEIEHKEKITKDYYRLKLRELRGENIWVEYLLWCNCQGDLSTKLKHSATNFANWLKEKKITLTEYQRRYIAEKHFGWFFNWNEKRKKWESRK